jgi:hypothetical protein
VHLFGVRRRQQRQVLAHYDVGHDHERHERQDRLEWPGAGTQARTRVRRVSPEKLTEFRTHVDAAAARKEYDKMIASKLKKGYCPV